MVILLQSHTFLHFDTIAVYDNFWILFYVASLYVINRKWQYSSPYHTCYLYFQRFLSEFFSCRQFTTYVRASISKRKKLYTLASYAGITNYNIIGFFVWRKHTFYLTVPQSWQVGGESNGFLA